LTTGERECRFFPTVAELRDLAGMPKAVARSQLGQAAWGEVVGCLTSGKWTELDQPTKAALKTLGGSWNVRQADERALVGLRNRFLEAYRPPAEVEERPALPPGDGPGKGQVLAMVRGLAAQKGGG
jgi:hypothetical protein